MIQLVKIFCPFMSQPVCNSVDGAANHYFSVIKGVSATSRLAVTLPSVCTFLSQPLINLIDRAHKLSVGK